MSSLKSCMTRSAEEEDLLHRDHGNVIKVLSRVDSTYVGRSQIGGEVAQKHARRANARFIRMRNQPYGCGLRSHRDDIVHVCRRVQVTAWCSERGKRKTLSRSWC